MRRKLHFAPVLLLPVLLFGFLASGFITSKRAEAADCSTLSITITQASSNVFYVENKTTPKLDSAYVAYKIQTGVGRSFTDLWVTAGSFSDATKLKLAPNEDGKYRVGSLSASSSAYVYFYLQGAPTATAQSYVLTLYDGNPANGAATTCTRSASHASVLDTLEAVANKVNSAVTTAPNLGSLFTMTIDGDTGTIGSSALFAYTPASVGTWPADCYELRDTTITLSGGNTGTYNKGLLITGLAQAATSYTLVYTFHAKCVTNTATSVTPINNISSGNNIKHTNIGTATYTSIPAINPATNGLTLTKSVSPTFSSGIATATPTYTLTLTNTSSSTVTVDSIKDTLPSSPANVSYVSGSSKYNGVAIANPTISGQNLTWNIDFAVPASATRTLTFQATIPATYGTYTNSAVGYILSTQIDASADTTVDTPATTIFNVGVPNLQTSTKTVSDLNGGTVEPGDSLRYTITIKNTGTGQGTGISVTDTIDNNTQSITNVTTSNCGSPVNSSTSTLLSISSITSNIATDCVLTFDVKVKTPLNEGTVIANIATISSSIEGGNGGTPSSPNLQVDATPALVVTKSEDDADDLVGPNQVIKYTITIKNNGNGQATGISLTDSIDAHLLADTGSFTFNLCGSPSNTSTASNLNISSITIAVGVTCTISYDTTVDIDAANGETIPNSVDVSAAAEGGNNPSPVSSTTLTVVNNNKPDFSTSTKTVSDLNGGLVEPGDTLRYTLSIINSGAAHGNGVSVTDTIDTNTSNLTNIVTGANSTSCGSPINASTSTDLNITNIKVLRATTCDITFDVTVNTPLSSGTALNNTAVISAATEGGSGGSPSSPTLYVKSTPVLSVAKSDDDADNMVDPSQVVTYTITVTNTGNGQGSFNLSDTITGDTSDATDFTFTDCSNFYSNLSSGKSISINELVVTTISPCVITYKVTVKSNAPGASTIANSVDVSAAAEGSNNPDPVSADTLTVASIPEFEVSKVEDDSDNYVEPGQKVLYTITITNIGNAKGTTSLTDTIPSDFGAPYDVLFTNCGATPASSFSAPNFSATSLVMNSGASCVVRYAVDVKSPLNEGVVLINSVDVAAAAEGGKNPGVVSASALTVDATPDLSTSTKTVSDLNGGAAEPGDTLSYTITVINTGNGQATGVSITDTISSQTTGVTNVQTTNCGTPSNSSSSTTLSLSGIVVNLGTNCVITFDVTVSATAEEGANIVNTATVNPSDQGGPGASPSTDPLVVDTTPSISIKSVEDDDDNNVGQNQLVTYTLTLENTGKGTGTITVTDLITGPVSSITNVSYTNCGTPTDETSSNNLKLTHVRVATTDKCIITYQVTVNSNASGGSTITNSADATAASEGGNDPASTSADTLTVNSFYILSVTKSEDDADNVVTPGQTVLYTITISNSGNATATTSLNDTIPSGFEAPTDVAYSDCDSPNSSYSAPLLSISNLKVDAGQDCVITYKVKVASPNVEGSTLVNSVDVAAASEGGNDPDPASADPLSVDVTPNLSTSTKTVNDINGGTVEPGDALVYTITIKNSGDGRASGITLEDTINSKTESVSDVVTTNCGTPINSSTADKLSLGSITVNVGTDCVVTFQVIVKSNAEEGATIGNSVTISSPSEGGPGGSPSSPNLTVDYTPILDVTVDDDDTDNYVYRNQDVTHTVNITNTGKGPASGVSLSGILSGPTGSILSLSSVNCGTITDSSSGSTLSISSITIKAGDTCTFSFVSKVNGNAEPASTIVLSADASAASEGGNNPASVNGQTLIVKAPKITTTLNVISTSQINVVTFDITYELKIKSIGNMLASDVQAEINLGNIETSGTTIESVKTYLIDAFLTDASLNNLFNGKTDKFIFANNPTGIQLDVPGGNDSGIVHIIVRIIKPLEVTIDDILADTTADDVTAESNKTKPTIVDEDKDGFVDSSESSTADRDNDGIPDAQDYDPQGYFYCSATGQILPGGSISVSGPGTVKIVSDGSNGSYQWYVSGKGGRYVMSVTPPAGTQIDTSRPVSAVLDPTGKPNPYAVGSSEYGSTRKLSDFSAAANPYHLEFDIELTDPWIISNNIPLTNCAALIPNTGLLRQSLTWYVLSAAGGVALLTTATVKITKKRQRRRAETSSTSK